MAYRELHAADWGITEGEIARAFAYVYREHGFTPPAG